MLAVIRAGIFDLDLSGSYLELISCLGYNEFAIRAEPRNSIELAGVTSTGFPVSPGFGLRTSVTLHAQSSKLLDSALADGIYGAMPRNKSLQGFFKRCLRPVILHSGESMLQNREAVWYILGMTDAFEIGCFQQRILVRQHRTTDGVDEGNARIARSGRGWL